MSYPALQGFPTWMGGNVPTPTQPLQNAIPKIQGGLPKTPMQVSGTAYQGAARLGAAPTLRRVVSRVAGPLSVPMALASAHKAYVPMDKPDANISRTDSWTPPKGKVVDTRATSYTNPFTGGLNIPVKDASTTTKGVEPETPIAPFDMSGFEEKQMEFLMKEFGNNADARRQGLADEQGNWGVVKIGEKDAPKGGSDTDEGMPSALPYDPRFEMANKANYAQATEAIDSRMKPAIGKMQGLLDEFRNYTPTGKSSIGAQSALSAIMGLTPQVANLHATNAEQVGRLPLMQEGQTAMRQGALPMQESMVSLFKEKLPSTKAEINYKNALGDKAAKETKHEASKIGLERAKLLIAAHAKQTGGVDPKILMEAKAQLNAGMITPDDYNEIIKTAAAYKQPVSALP